MPLFGGSSSRGDLESALYELANDFALTAGGLQPSGLLEDHLERKSPEIAALFKTVTAEGGSGQVEKAVKKAQKYAWNVFTQQPHDSFRPGSPLREEYERYMRTIKGLAH